jgi:hypothetical protein
MGEVSNRNQAFKIVKKLIKENKIDSLCDWTWDLITYTHITDKVNQSLHTALDKLISDSVMPHGDKDKIQKFKENLLNQVKEGKG